MVITTSLELHQVISTSTTTGKKKAIAFYVACERSSELQETGMYDYGARFYMPELGRFGTHDPMSEITLEPYSYVWNNPLFYNDPTGMIGEIAGTDPNDPNRRGGDNNPIPIQEVKLVGKKKESAALVAFQTTLDIVGIWDPFGIADGINAGIYLYKGDYKNAAISAIGIVPFIGDFGKGYKYGAKALSKVDEVVEATKEVQGIYEITTKARKNTSENLKM